MALVSYIPRALPVTLFSRPIKSKFIKSFLYYVPYAVLSSLTFPGIFFSTGSVIAATAGTATALVLAFFERSLVVVAAVTVLVVFLVGFII
ncbi:MAG: AzlD domain-containing protein [Lachnospiraceae bacterium]|nr:AzlD domain-containing protein [Lachnospiraceae bacterium]